MPALRNSCRNYIATRLQSSEFDPDVSPPVIIRDVSETRAKLASVAGSKYSYAQLDDFTDLIGRTLLGVPQTSRVERKGVLPQAIYLDYSQERLAAYGFQAGDLSRILNARNITLPGGSLEAGGRDIQLDPSGQFDSAEVDRQRRSSARRPAAHRLSARPGADQPRLSDPCARI